MTSTPWVATPMETPPESATTTRSRAARCYPVTTFADGEVLGGTYEIRGLLGRGGMGQV
ncbi:MAG: hypothetical protein U0235_28645 [Polyangiaceae bacterium]